MMFDVTLDAGGTMDNTAQFLQRLNGSDLKSEPLAATE
jgi:hypothetical protein